MKNDIFVTRRVPRVSTHLSFFLRGYSFESTKNDTKITFVFLFRFFFRFVTGMRMLEERGDVEEYLVSIIFRGEKK